MFFQNSRATSHFIYRVFSYEIPNLISWCSGCAQVHKPTSEITHPKQPLSFINNRNNQETNFSERRNPGTSTCNNTLYTGGNVIYWKLIGWAHEFQTAPVHHIYFNNELTVPTERLQDMQRFTDLQSKEGNGLLSTRGSYLANIKLGS